MCRDPRRDEGQALAVLVALIGFAAFVILALGAANGRLLVRVDAQRAAESAAEAAGAVVADAVVELREEPAGHEERDLIAVVLADAAVHAAAEAAARELLAANGGGDIERLVLERRVDEVSVKVEIRRDGVRALARVGVPAR